MLRNFQNIKRGETIEPCSLDPRQKWILISAQKRYWLYLDGYQLSAYGLRMPEESSSSSYIRRKMPFFFFCLVVVLLQNGQLNYNSLIHFQDSLIHSHFQHIVKDINVKKCNVHESLMVPGLRSKSITAGGVLILDSSMKFLKSNLGHLSSILHVSLSR